MNLKQNRRTQFRRYADRRITALLELHEILFYEEATLDRTVHLMNTLNEDYQTDRVAIVQCSSSDESAVEVRSASVRWPAGSKAGILHGAGIARIIQTHREFEGALTLSRFRSSSAFEESEWQSLWENDLGAPATALLSVPVFPKGQSTAFLWLVVDSGSREWSSHDRDLSEEESVLFARVLERGLLGG